MSVWGHEHAFRAAVATSVMLRTSDKVPRAKTARRAVGRNRSRGTALPRVAWAGCCCSFNFWPHGTDDRENPLANIRQYQSNAAHRTSRESGRLQDL